MAEPLDPIDMRILQCLQTDSDLPVVQIAEICGLSVSPCWRRIKRLEEDGIIRKRVTLLDADRLGLGFEAYAAVKLSTPTRLNLEAFEALLSLWPEVVDGSTVTGREDYILHIRTTDMHAYDDFLRDQLLASDLVSSVESRICVRPVKSTTALPLNLITKT